jgi:hypothetical protein
VVAEELGREARVADLFVHDCSGGVPQPVRVQAAGDLVVGADPGADRLRRGRLEVGEQGVQPCQRLGAFAGWSIETRHVRRPR